MRLLTQLAIAAAATACAGVRAPAPASLTPSPRVATFESLNNSAPNTPTRLVIVVRDVDEPERGVVGAIVYLGRDKTDLRSDSALHASSNGDGVVALERLVPGEYAVLVRRLGYASFQFGVNLQPQCREVLEVYIGKAPLCLLQCSPTPGRAVLTTCRRLSNERREE